MITVSITNTFQMAVRAWGRLITLVMEDTSEPEIFSLENLYKKPEPGSSCDILSSAKQAKRGDKMMHLMNEKRTKNWYNMASEKLKILIKSLVDLTQHSNKKVRLELHECTKVLLFSCTR